MLEELEGQLDLKRLHFTGLLNYGELVQLFRRSDLHCYFTRPYVVSWGVFQAVACGARLLVNDFRVSMKCLMESPSSPRLISTIKSRLMLLLLNTRVEKESKFCWSALFAFTVVMHQQLGSTGLFIL